MAEEWENLAKDISRASISTRLNPSADEWLPSQQSSNDSQEQVDNDNPDSIDQALLLALENPQERLNVLKFEDMITEFMKDKRRYTLEFPIMSSYSRMLVHRLAQRFNLDHQAVEVDPYDMVDIRYSKGIVLLKTSQSRIPSVQLLDLSSSQEEAEKPGPKMILKRRPQKHTEQVIPSEIEDPQASTKQVMTVEEREKAYAEARARIFGNEEPDPAEDTNLRVVEIASPPKSSPPQIAPNSAIQSRPAQTFTPQFAYPPPHQPYHPIQQASHTFPTSIPQVQPGGIAAQTQPYVPYTAPYGNQHQVMYHPMASQPLQPQTYMHFPHPQVSYSQPTFSQPIHSSNSTRAGSGRVYSSLINRADPDFQRQRANGLRNTSDGRPQTEPPPRNDHNEFPPLGS